MHTDQSTASQLASFIRGLRSVRRFAPTPIADDVLHEILDVGRWTGSSKNTQPWSIVVVRNRDTLRELAACGTFAGHLADAQIGIALVMDDQQRRLDEGRLAQNLMLAAWAFGIGSCIGTMQPPEAAARAKQILGIPDERWLSTCLSLGYPADDQALRVPANLRSVGVPTGRMPFDTFVRWEHY
jgi:nitroreductase